MLFLDIVPDSTSITDDMLKEFDLIPSKTSLFRYLTLPKDFDDIEIEHHCLKSGVQVFSSKRFSTGMNSKHNAIRISIGSPQNENELIKGLAIIRDVIKSYRYKFEPIV